jgi:hypothetical protein
MLTIPTSYSKGGGFRREGRSADDDTGYADKVRDIVRGEVADRELRCRRMEQKLVFGELDVLLRRVDDSLRADFESCFELYTVSA